MFVLIILLSSRAIERNSLATFRGRQVNTSPNAAKDKQTRDSKPAVSGASKWVLYTPNGGPEAYPTARTCFDNREHSLIGGPEDRQTRRKMPTSSRHKTSANVRARACCANFTQQIAHRKVIRGLATGRFTPDAACALRIVGGQAIVGLVLGTALAIGGFIRVWVTDGTSLRYYYTLLVAAFGPSTVMVLSLYFVRGGETEK